MHSAVFSTSEITLIPDEYTHAGLIWSSC